MRRKWGHERATRLERADGIPAITHGEADGRIGPLYRGGVQAQKTRIKLKDFFLFIGLNL